MTFIDWMKIYKGRYAQRNYKDTVFRMLFSDKKELLALYNAVNGTHYTDPEKLQITTLEGAIYMHIKNDLSFILDLRLELYEHQSTVNPNLPLRYLLYVAKVFEELVIGKDLYARTLIKLPTPRFITFYNGREEQPERLVRRLSDSYHITEDNPSLELRVIQLNINEGYNEKLKNNCPTLQQYMLYVDRVREYNLLYPLNEAVEKAVDECIQEGILREFLLENKAKVVSMSIFEYDEELHNRTLYNEGLEDGHAKGHAEGKAEGLAEGKAEGADLKLIEQVCKKLQKGKGAEQIAKDLEEDFSVIQRICQAAEAYAPEYAEKEAIYEKVYRKDRPRANKSFKNN